MGLTYIDGIVRGPSGKKTELRFGLDSGASYSLISRDQWKAIELSPKRSMKFTLADGTKISRQVSECYISLPQGEGHTPVILGEDGDEPLLGVITLEILGSIFNPFNRTLQPMRALLA